MLWLPLVMAMIVFVSDFSMVMFNRSNAMRVIEDTNRERAVGVIASPDDVRTRVLGRLVDRNGDPIGSVQTYEVLGMVRTRIDIPIENIDLFGVMRMLTGTHSFTVYNSMMIEDFNA
ncbi:hypothetical protein HKCCE3408_08700 [Rhodobacterales bacterium HKCCE3408]|nr:hypothetical protein [Rhodobacterales bacterium HKCCE3408]